MTVTHRPSRLLHAIVMPLLALPGRPLLAQEPGSLVTDRPDQTESASALPARMIQIELGMTLVRETSDASSLTRLAAPGTLVRVGIGAGIELRAGIDGWQGTVSGGDGGPVAAEGFGDGRLGVKWAIDTGSALDLALLAGATVPTGVDGITSRRWDPHVLVLLAHAVGERVGFGYNVGFVAGTEGDGMARETLWALPYTFSIGIGVSDVVGAFVESFGALPLSASERAEHSLDAGFTLRLSDSLQLDLSAGAGLDADAAEWFVGTGVSKRFPR